MLDFTQSNVRDEDISSKDMSNVTSLSLRETPITGSCFGHLSGLNELILFGCESVRFSEIVHLKALKLLNVSYTNISDDDLKYLCNIESLILCCTDITDRGLMQLKNVQEVDLRGCQSITNIGLKYLDDNGIKYNNDPVLRVTKMIPK